MPRLFSRRPASWFRRRCTLWTGAAFWSWAAFTEPSPGTNLFVAVPRTCDSKRHMCDATEEHAADRGVAVGTHDDQVCPLRLATETLGALQDCPAGRIGDGLGRDGPARKRGPHACCAALRDDACFGEYFLKTHMPFLDRLRDFRREPDRPFCGNLRRLQSFSTNVTCMFT